jgi:hypothetical protein
MEAAAGVPYRRPTLRTLKLLLRCTPAEEEEDYDVVFSAQEAKYVESWPNTTSAWADRGRFYIPADKPNRVHSLLICTGCTLRLLPLSGLDSRKILIEQNIKRRTGPALYVFSLLGLCLTPSLLYYYSYTSIYCTMQYRTCIFMF